jgi:hypothetical protein
MITLPSDRLGRALRARMIEDMNVRGFSEKTRNDYIRNVRAFAAFVGRSPDTATAEDLRRFQHHQAQTGVRPPSDPHGDQPARPACGADRTEPENRGVARRPCAAQGWRSQASFIAMAPPGARPTPGI